MQNTLASFLAQGGSIACLEVTINAVIVKDLASGIIINSIKRTSPKTREWL